MILLQKTSEDFTHVPNVSQTDDMRDPNMSDKEQIGHLFLRDKGTIWPTNSDGIADIKVHDRKVTFGSKHTYHDKCS